MSKRAFLDCPRCPKCRLTCGTTDDDERAHRSLPTLTCAACGHQWIGSDAEIAKAVKADAAYERWCKREAKGRNRRGAYARSLSANSWL